MSGAIPQSPSVFPAASSRQSPPSPQVLRRSILWTCVVVAVATVLRLWAAAVMDYGNGEAYYVASARIFDLSWFDQPPLFLWLLHGWGQWLGGLEPFTARLPFIGMSVVSSGLLFLLSFRLFGAWPAFWAVLFFNLSGVFTLSIASWPQPDGPLILFWLATALVLERLLISARSPHARQSKQNGLGLWVLVGLCLGLAFLSKYHAAFLVFGTVLFVLTTPGRRSLLWARGPWLALGITAVMFLPVILWNAENGWASFAFQGGRAGGSGLHPEWLLRMIVGQAVWILPWIWLPMIWVFARALWRGPKDPAGWFCALLAIGPIAVFTIISLWASLGFHFHWQAPGYLMLFPLLGRATAGMIGSVRAKTVRWARRWVIGSCVATAGALLILVVQASTGLLGLLLPKDLPDPTLESAPWTDLRPGLERARQAFDRQGPDFVMATHWVECGKVDAALGDLLPVLCLGDDPRNLAFTHDPADYVGKNAWIIGSARRLSHPAAFLDQSFDVVETGETLTIHRGKTPAFDLDTRLGRGFTLDRTYALNGREPASVFGAGFALDPESIGEPVTLANGSVVRPLDPETGQAAFYLLMEGRQIPRHLDLRLYANDAGGDGAVPVRILWSGQTMNRVLWEPEALAEPYVPVHAGPGDPLDVRITLPRRTPSVGRWLVKIILETDVEPAVAQAEDGLPPLLIGSIALR